MKEQWNLHFEQSLVKACLPWATLLLLLTKMEQWMNKLLKTLACGGWVGGGGRGKFLGEDRVFLIVSETIAG